MGIVLSLGWSLSIDYNSGVRCGVLVALDLWTGLYKLGFMVSAGIQSKELLCDGAKNLIPPSLPS